MEQHRQEIKDHYQQHLEDIDQHHQEVRRHNHEMKIEIEQHHEGMVEHVAVQRTHLEQNMQQQQQSAIVAVQAVYQSAALQMTGLVNQMESKMETLEVKLVNWRLIR